MRFEHAGTQAAFDDYRGAVDALVIRRDELERQIAAQLPLSPFAQTAQRLMCLRGIDTLTAAGLCAEIGDFGRFRHPEQLMSHLGVVPSEHSSGTRRRQGSITKSGSQHARRLLVEAAWHYRQPPRISEPLRRRQAGADAEIVALSWKTQRRLHRVWTRMEQRGKRRTIIAVAAARELAGSVVPPNRMPIVVAAIATAPARRFPLPGRFSSVAASTPQCLDSAYAITPTVDAGAIAAGAAEDPITLPIARRDPVAACAAGEGVTSAPTVEAIVAGFAENPVIAGASLDAVVARTAEESVVASAADDPVIAALAADDVAL